MVVEIPLVAADGSVLFVGTSERSPESNETLCSSLQSATSYEAVDED